MCCFYLLFAVLDRYLCPTELINSAEHLISFIELYAYRVPFLEIIKLNKPYLGICLGAQLLAKSLGAEVKINKAKELGNYTIKLTREGQADALFNGLSTRLNVFQWHGETFDIPRDAVKLAYCRSCANQAFKYKNSYGIQFHLEITPEMLKTWLQIPEYRVELNHQGLHVFEIAQDFAKNYSSYRKNCRILINNYLNSAENELAS